MLPQITRDNFFSMKGQGQNFGVGWHNHKKQRTRCVSTNHKGQFFSMKWQGQKLVVGRHKSQLIEEKVC